MADAKFDYDLFTYQDPSDKATSDPLNPIVSQSSDTKVCSICKEPRPKTEFTNDKSRVDGLNPRCKACHNAIKAEKHRAKQLEKIASGTKRCEGCDQIKAASDFNRVDGDRLALDRFCKECQALYGKQKIKRYPFRRSPNAVSNNKAYRSRLSARECVKSPERQVCIRCNQDKPSSAFSKSASEKWGIKRICKDCAILERLEMMAKPRKKPAYIRTCTQCERSLPPSEFNKRSDSPDGLAPHCRDCDQKRAMQWYAVPGNAERAAANARAWAETNPEANAAARLVAKHNRRMAEQNAEGSFTFAEWAELLDYYGDCCAYCLRHSSVAGNMTVEHMTPLSRGGTNYIENIVPACKSCNSSKRASNILEFIARDWLPPSMREMTPPSD